MQDAFTAYHDYMRTLLPKPHPVVKEMEKLAKERDFPIVGPLVGVFLSQLVRLSGTREVLELGSGFGYSAYWIASALPEEGKIICTDASEENARTGMEFLRHAGLGEKVEYRVGDAVEILRSNPGPLEFVFNDVDKRQYPEVFRIVVPRLRSGGVLVSDNLLWHGRVVSGEKDTDTEGIRSYTRLMFRDPNLISSIIPLRDGLGLCLKH
jgi:predicted O-methyltransferase YrrM